jgi:hypothetical protein
MAEPRLTPDPQWVDGVEPDEEPQGSAEEKDEAVPEEHVASDA